MRCHYCSSSDVRWSTSKPITECRSCGRITSEQLSQPPFSLFHLQASLSPLLLSTSDLPSSEPLPSSSLSDPFHPTTAFITAFSTWSLHPHPLFLSPSLSSSSGHLAELERRVFSDPSSASGPSVVVDNLRAYLQIVDVASILGLHCDISDHAFQLFRDCSSATCLRNRSVEALATAALVQAIREAQEPRTLQEISLAANLPQKEIGKYIKILGEALQLSQPINSNSIAVHMPRFCTLLQLNKSAQNMEHVGMDVDGQDEFGLDSLLGMPAPADIPASRPFDQEVDSQKRREREIGAEDEDISRPKRSCAALDLPVASEVPALISQYVGQSLELVKDFSNLDLMEKIRDLAFFAGALATRGVSNEADVVALAKERDSSASRIAELEEEKKELNGLVEELKGKVEEQSNDLASAQRSVSNASKQVADAKAAADRAIADERAKGQQTRVNYQEKLTLIGKHMNARSFNQHLSSLRSLNVPFDRAVWRSFVWLFPGAAPFALGKDFDWSRAEVLPVPPIGSTPSVSTAPSPSAQPGKAPSFKA